MNKETVEKIKETLTKRIKEVLMPFATEHWTKDVKERMIERITDIFEEASIEVLGESPIRVVSVGPDPEDPYKMHIKLKGPRHLLEQKPFNDPVPNGKKCSVCLKDQYDTPAGTTCDEGHGGADSHE